VEQYQYLFTPIKIGPMTVPNRIVMNAHAHRFHSSLGPPNEKARDYYAARAKGGVGLIVMPYASVAPYTTAGGRPATQDDKVLPAFASVVKAIHEHDTRVIAQLHHHGKYASPRLYGGAAYAPSAVGGGILPAGFSGPPEVPHEMDIDEIKRTVQAYGSAAYNMRQAGYDGVEISAVISFLLASFMSPATNRRTDEYGGSLENRLRFPLEVIDAVRAAVGSDFVVGMRIDGDEYIEGGLTLDDTRVIAPKLEATGKLDYLNIAAGAYPTPHVPPMYFPLGPFVYLSAGIKEVVSLPVFCVGRINDPIQAETILANNQADMVGMTRALIADPELPNKAREGRLEEIRKCISCNDGCWGPLFAPAVPLTCAINPEAGREKELALKPATGKKRVMVIGGGAAGLETARVAALRGHQVTLYEKEAQLGGQLNIVAKAPGRADFAEVTRYYTSQMKSLNVEVHLGTEVTAEMVKEVNPDAVVVATGSLPGKPKLAGSEMVKVVETRKVIEERVKVGNNILVVDEEYHMQPLEVADFLADRGARVEVVTETLFAGSVVDESTLSAIYDRLFNKGVVITPLTKVKEIKGDTVTVFNVFTKAEREIKGVDTVVIASSGKADDALYCSLKGQVKELHAVGQCVSPRQLRDSIWDGARVGRQL
jgi:mycofactocin system FadH/OYE family oxidoreductase 2